MAVADKLSGFSSGSGEAETENNIVKSGLEQHHEVGTGHALLSVGFLVVCAELFLEHTVDELCLLFLTELNAVFALFAAHALRLSVRGLVNSKVGRIKFERSALLKNRVSVNCHVK